MTGRESPVDARHPCPAPPVRRKWRNRLWVCDCGKAWRLVRRKNYADDGFEWQEWTP